MVVLCYCSQIVNISSWIKLPSNSCIWLNTMRNLVFDWLTDWLTDWLIHWFYLRPNVEIEIRLKAFKKKRHYHSCKQHNSYQTIDIPRKSLKYITPSFQHLRVTISKSFSQTENHHSDVYLHKRFFFRWIRSCRAHECPTKALFKQTSIVHYTTLPEQLSLNQSRSPVDATTTHRSGSVVTEDGSCPAVFFSPSLRVKGKVV